MADDLWRLLLYIAFIMAVKMRTSIKKIIMESYVGCILMHGIFALLTGVDGKFYQLKYLLIVIMMSALPETSVA